MEPPKTLRTRSPQRGNPAWLIPTGHQHGSHFSLLPEPPVDPKARPKICWVGLCHPIHWDQAQRRNRGGSSPKYLGCATSGASRDAPQLELPHLDVSTAGGGPSSQGRVRLRHLLASPGNLSPPHPTAPTPATLHPHPSGVSTPKYPKKPTKREKRNLQASTQNSASPNMCPSPLHIPTVKKKKPGIKPKAENTERSLMEFSKTFPAGRASEIGFGDINDNKLPLPSDASKCLHLQSQLIGTQLSE